MKAHSEISTSSDRRLLRSLLLCFLTVIATASLQGQTYNILFNFSQGQTGLTPMAGVTLDAGGSLYGTTTFGGRTTGPCLNRGGCGAVYKLIRRGSGWIMTSLYTFQDGQDGSDPWARVVFGPDGSLYGTTYSGGGSGCNQGYDIGCGTVFKLRPPAHSCAATSCPWNETVLYRFTGGDDGANPGAGDLIFDSAGNIYGTTMAGGSNGDGTVYKLTRSGNTWTESVLHSFSALQDNGRLPFGGVILVNGNLYGTTMCSGYEAFCIGGMIYELSPSGSNFQTVSVFNNGWSFSQASLTPDGQGSFYGTTMSGGNGNCQDQFENNFGCGVVFHGAADPVFENFPNTANFPGLSGPMAPVSVDAQGHIYGTTTADGAYSAGNVFELTFDGVNWNYATMHDFGQVNDDGTLPMGNVAVGSDGTLYGTTNRGGTASGGVIWELSPVER